jgi:hypothetical protein
MQIDRFSSSVQSRLVRRAIKHHSVHYRWWTLTGTIITRQCGQTGRLRMTSRVSGLGVGFRWCVCYIRPIHYTKWTDSAGNDRYGCEIIAEKVDFLSRPKSAENENPELVDRDDEIPF